MPTAREIRRRMSSVRNIRQITRAMELIAVTRLRRAQQRVLASRPYSDKMRQVLGELVRRVAVPAGDDAASLDGAMAASVHELLDRRAVRRVGLVLLTTDRGLCGALNTNTVRTALQYAYEQLNQRREVEVVNVGRKGLQLLRRQQLPIVAEFTTLGDYPSVARTLPISRVAMDAFTSHQVDEVALVYPRFVSTLRQEPTIVPLLPIQPPAEVDRPEHSSGEVDYIYEPDPRAVLAALLPRFVEVQVYQAVLEMVASEFSARMVAMRNATDNASELLNDLQLGANKARQATITREIIEVSSGAAAREQ
jgi:F-type H+-transporting ATPase subunit gamma